MLDLPPDIVALQPYNPAWQRLFREERESVLAAIGAHVLEVQHVGSTAVPGLPAKPILDLGVAVANYEAAAVCIAPLETLGYTYLGEYGIPRRHYFVREPPRTHNLHMNEIHSADYYRQLCLRAALRNNPVLVLAYAALKHELAAQFPADLAAYTNGKTEFITRVLQQAGCG